MKILALLTLVLFICSCERPDHGPLSGKNPNSIDGGYYGNGPVKAHFISQCKKGECVEQKIVFDPYFVRLGRVGEGYYARGRCDLSHIDPTKAINTDLIIDGQNQKIDYKIQSHEECTYVFFDTLMQARNFCQAIHSSFSKENDQSCTQPCVSNKDEDTFCLE